MTASKPKQITYHFHALCCPNPATTMHSDGLVVTSDIPTPATYPGLRAALAARFTPPQDPAQVVISSLTRL